MSIQYPGVIPDLLTRFGLNPLSFSSYTDLLRELQAALNTLGVNPQGGGGTVDGRLDAIEATLAAPARAIITADSTAITPGTTEQNFSNGNLLVLGNSPIVARSFRMMAGGSMTTGGSSTMTLRIRYGNTTSDAILLQLSGTVPTLLNQGWWMTGLITIRSVGTSGTAIGDGYGQCGPSSNLMDTVYLPATINTTIDKYLTLSVQFSAAVGGGITLQTFLMEQVN